MSQMIDYPLERLRASARRTPAFDPFPLLEALHRHGAVAVVIGQVAGIMHGSIEPTGDLDLLWDGSPAHAPALAAALASVGARLADERGGPLAMRPESLLRPKVQFTSPGAVGDCCTPALPWGNLSVRECLDRAITTVDPGGLAVRYVSREDLILMRRALGRPKDLRRADELDAAAGS
ncbi:hypothetical protein ACIBG8_08285 [Nonomuraea sp. NPDC050556]|uniref:hypothetical protein n=1 Tax=Nonomuraea sp. NPDC050556 TaxID=3364369 RepID=UPI0037BB6099